MMCVVGVCVECVFFFKQKTAYEMRISDWSSDVCSSDLFAPGGASLHNCMSAHGPDRRSAEAAMAAKLEPHKIDDTLTFMFESSRNIRPTAFDIETHALPSNYDACWGDFETARLPAEDRSNRRG